MPKEVTRFRQRPDCNCQRSRHDAIPTQNPPVTRTEPRRLAMKRVITMTCLTLVVTLLVALGTTVDAGPKASPPQSAAFGKRLPEWMQLYITWLLAGGSDHVGPVTFLAIPSGNVIEGTGTFDDPATVQGHLDVRQAPGTPFVLAVVGWFGETYLPSLGYPDDPPLPAEFFTDPSKATIKVYVDGTRVMDSTIASVSPFYYGPVDLDVTYPAPTSYGSTGAIFTQGIGFVHPPLSVGTHTIQLDAGLRVPLDSSF